MKKNFLLILASACAVLAGCDKSEIESNDPAPSEAPSKSFVATFALNDETRTTASYSGDKCYVLWEASDVIKVSADGENYYDFKVKSLAMNNMQAVFEPVNPDDAALTDEFFNQHSYKATFGTKDLTSFTQSAAGSLRHLYMESVANELRQLSFSVTEPVLAVTIPKGVSVKSVKVFSGSTEKATIKSSTALGEYFIPVAADDEAKYEISAYSDEAWSTEIAESMKMYSAQSIEAGKIYPFTFTPTLKITSAGTYSLKDYAGDYKVWVCNEDQTAGVSVTDAAITIQYAGSTHPANVYLDAKGSIITNLTITTPDSHFVLSNGTSTNITSQTSKSTLVVKPSYTITAAATVRAGSITVEGKKEGSNTVKNVNEIVLDYAYEYNNVATLSDEEKATLKEKMEGVVVSVTEVTSGDPVTITNNTKSTDATPITVVGEDNTTKSNTDNGGFKVQGGDVNKQNITIKEKIAAKIGDTVYATLEAAVAAAQTGETITLIDDIPVLEEQGDVFLRFADNVTLDLNGHTLNNGILCTTNSGWDYNTGYAYVFEGKGFTIKNGIINGETRDDGYCYALYIGNDEEGNEATSDVTVEDVVFPDGGINILDATNVLLKDCDVTVEPTKYYAVCIGEDGAGNHASVTIDGGTYRHGTNGNVIHTMSQGQLGAEMTIKNGYFEGNLYVENGCPLTVTGGAFSVDPSDYIPSAGYKVTGPYKGYYYVDLKTGVAATIGTAEYSTLAEAFAAVQNGETITLVNDCETGKEYVLQNNMLCLDEENVTLDLNGNTITVTNNFSFAITANNVTVKNGRIESGATSTNPNDDDYRACGYHSFSLVVGAMNSGNTITGVQIEDVIFQGGISFGGSSDNLTSQCTGAGCGTLKDCEIVSGMSSAIYAQQSGSTATVLSGTYTRHSKATNPVISTEGSTDVYVKGGTFNENPSALGTNNYVADGYQAVANGDGTYTVTQAGVCKIGTQYYESLAEAFDAIADNGTAEIILVSDKSITFNTESYVEVKSGQTVTLDLNGFTIVSGTSFTGNSQLILNNGTLTIKDSKSGGTINHGANPTWIYDGSGVYEGSYASNIITNQGNLTVNGGTLYNISTGSAAYAIDSRTNGDLYSPVFTVNSGNLRSNANAAIRMFLNSPTNDNIGVINGGYIRANYYALSIHDPNNYANKGNVSITGGEFEADADSWNCSVVCWTGEDHSNIYVNISDGKFNDYVAFDDYGIHASITGGLYKYKDYGDDYHVSTFVPSGYQVVDNTDSSTKNNYPWKVVASN